MPKLFIDKLIKKTKIERVYMKLIKSLRLNKYNKYVTFERNCPCINKPQNIKI